MTTLPTSQSDQAIAINLVLILLSTANDPLVLLSGKLAVIAESANLRTTMSIVETLLNATPIGKTS